MLLTLMVAGLLGSASSQKAGYVRGEAQPPLTLKRCTAAEGCYLEQTSVTIDAQWRWLHAGEEQHFHSCYQGYRWDELNCLDPDKCARHCALDGSSLQDYEKTYGVKSIPGGLELKYVTPNSVGSRLYAMDGGGDRYKLWKLKNREFTFDVDVSSLGCGLNGALYFVEMKGDGGLGLGHNAAGAKFGTGYCDAQCPHDLKFIDGEANVLNWHMGPVGPVGRYGSCCAELDIWEANRISTAYTAHPCTIEGQLRCEGPRCGDTPDFCDCCDTPDSCPCCLRYRGVCDKDGCDFNSYRMGVHTFYGPGSDFSVDTKRPITVVTQFLTDDGTDDGELVEIRRLYVQDGKVINNSAASVLTADHEADSITGRYCKIQKEEFKNPDDFTRKGGLKPMGEALARGMVLVLSLWDDGLTHMDWLDSSVGNGKISRKRPGVMRGPCSVTSGDPKELRAQHGGAFVRYGNISYGEIGSTYGAPAERIVYPPPPVTLIVAVAAVAGMAALLGVAGLFAIGRLKSSRLTFKRPSVIYDTEDGEDGGKPLVAAHEVSMD